jgi:hypothetical protein
MVKIITSESKILKFALDIEGSQSTPDINYIIESEPFSYSFPGTVENGKVEVDIPELHELIKPGKYKAKLDVVLDESFYSPWTGDVVVETPVEIKVEEEIEEIVEDKKSKVEVKLTEDIIPPKKVKKVIKKVAKKKVFEKKPTVSLFEDILK